jgi:deoxyribose-phosphate aldolase
MFMGRISRYIDHTALKPELTKLEIENLCLEAKEYQFAAVCVNPSWVSLSSSLLKGTSVAIATVIGFPLGSTTTKTKVYEAREAVTNGANEIDMVIHIGKLKDRNIEYIENDIREVVDAVRDEAIVKVIIETALLTNEEKIVACEAATRAGAHFVKTSTGFSSGGALVEDVTLMRATVGPSIGVKASGGVRDYETARKMIEAGASRIGTSSGVSIVNGGKGSEDY